MVRCLYKNCRKYLKTTTMLHYSTYSYYVTIILVYFCYLPTPIDRVKAIEHDDTQFTYKSIFQNGLCSSLFDLEQCFVMEKAIKSVVNELGQRTNRDKSDHVEKLLNISKQLKEVKLQLDTETSSLSQEQVNLSNEIRKLKRQNKELKARVRKIEKPVKGKTKRNNTNSSVRWHSRRTQLNKSINKRPPRVRRDLHYIDPPNGYNHDGVYYYQYQTSAIFANQTKVYFI